MFEVIISTINTGRVQRKSFDSRDAAQRYIDGRAARWEAGKRNKEQARSFFNTYRVEIERRQPAVVLPVGAGAAAAA